MNLTARKIEPDFYALLDMSGATIGYAFPFRYDGTWLAHVALDEGRWRKGWHGYGGSLEDAVRELKRAVRFVQPDKIPNNLHVAVDNT